MKKYKVMMDYCADPLWCEEGGNLDPSHEGFPDGIITLLYEYAEAWIHHYDFTSLYGEGRMHTPEMVDRLAEDCARKIAALDDTYKVTWFSEVDGEYHEVK